MRYRLLDLLGLSWPDLKGLLRGLFRAQVVASRQAHPFLPRDPGHGWPGKLKSLRPAEDASVLRSPQSDLGWGGVEVSQPAGPGPEVKLMLEANHLEGSPSESTFVHPARRDVRGPERKALHCQKVEHESRHTWVGPRSLLLQMCSRRTGLLS